MFVYCRYIRFVCFSVLVLLLSVRLTGQIISAKTALDTSRALIGDQLKLRLTAEMPAEVTVAFPETGDKLTDEIEVIAKSDISHTSRSEGLEELDQELLITVFDTGFFEIPSLKFVFHSGELTDTIETLPVAFQILSLPLDPDIRDIKANFSAPVTLREIYPYILAGLLIIVAIWIIRGYYLRKYKSIPVSLANPKLDPPDVFALNEIEKLRKDAPWLNNRIKHYYIRLSEIIRNYIEQQFQITALEQTTGEILYSIENTSCDVRSIELLTQLLTLADLVKFAKVIPDKQENADQIDLAIAFIKSSSACILIPHQAAGELESEGIKESVE